MFPRLGKKGGEEVDFGKLFADPNNAPTQQTKRPVPLPVTNIYPRLTGDGGQL